MPIVELLTNALRVTQAIAIIKYPNHHAIYNPAIEAKLINTAKSKFISDVVSNIDACHQQLKALMLSYCKLSRFIQYYFHAQWKASGNFQFLSALKAQQNIVMDTAGGFLAEGESLPRYQGNDRLSDYLLNLCRTAIVNSNEIIFEQLQQASHNFSSLTPSDFHKCIAAGLGLDETVTLSQCLNAFNSENNPFKHLHAHDPHAYDSWHQETAWQEITEQLCDAIQSIHAFSHPPELLASNAVKGTFHGL